MFDVPEPTPTIRQSPVSAPALKGLYAELAQTGLVRRVIELCRDEDLGPATGPGDITTRCTVAPDEPGLAAIVPRQAGVVAGLACVPEILAVFAPTVTFAELTHDSAPALAGVKVGTLSGPRAGILAAERTVLNMIGRLSGVATRTAQFVDAVRAANPPRPVQLCDTRKTTPGLRVLEKYAVRCGGGHSHRLGLHDAVLIKDNHLAGVGNDTLPQLLDGAIRKALEMTARTGTTLGFIEVEVDTLGQLDAIMRGCRERLDIVLLDNMPPAQLREAVRMRDACRPQLVLEASGGVRLETVGEIARTGVDRISAGSLTHGAVSLDFGLDALDAEPVR